MTTIKSVFWGLLWRFWVGGMVFFGAGSGLLAYEIHIHTFIVSGYMILALWTAGISMWATGAAALWEIKHGRR